MNLSKNMIERLAGANHVAVLTGAGVSAESGIKTFRDPDGLWAKLNPQQLASIDGFMKDPKTVWAWYQERRDIIANCKPNPGHFALAEFSKIFPKFDLITQNVDRLHQSAGSENVIELHGNIIDNRCFDCGKPYNEDISTKELDIPKCKSCGGKIRPCVVWFGEMLPEKALSQADYISRTCDVFLSIGTSAEVYPAAHLPVAAKQSGAFVIEINPNETSISRFMDCVIRETSAKALPAIIEELKKII